MICMALSVGADGRRFRADPLKTKRIHFSRKEAGQIAVAKEHTYIAIDLKSFYASVECLGLGLDPLGTNLVVADESRTGKTICLAVTPSLKAYGISGRARLFEVRHLQVTMPPSKRRHGGHRNGWKWPIEFPFLWRKSWKLPFFSQNNCCCLSLSKRIC